MEERLILCCTTQQKTLRRLKSCFSLVFSSLEFLLLWVLFWWGWGCYRCFHGSGMCCNVLNTVSERYHETQAVYSIQQDWYDWHSIHKSRNEKPAESDSLKSSISSSVHELCLKYLCLSGTSRWHPDKMYYTVLPRVLTIKQMLLFH